MKEEEEFQANRSSNRKIRQFTRGESRFCVQLLQHRRTNPTNARTRRALAYTGTSAAVEVFSRFENPHDQLNERKTQPRRWMKASIQTTKAAAETLKQKGVAQTTRLPDTLTNSNSRHLRRLHGLEVAAKVLEGSLSAEKSAPPAASSTQFEPWVRSKFGAVDPPPSKRRAKRQAVDDSAMDDDATKAAIIRSLKTIFLETFYPQPSAVIKAMLSARWDPGSPDNSSANRVFHGIQDAREAWQSDKFKIITFVCSPWSGGWFSLGCCFVSAFRLLRTRIQDGISAAYNALVPEHVQATAKPSVMWEWYV